MSFLWTCVHSIQGASLEIMVPDEADLPNFVSQWITAASDAAGQCAKVTADLEPLESQTALIDLIVNASQGISASRKALTALGHQPSAQEVKLELTKAGICAPKCDYSLLLTPSVYTGREVCGGLPQAHQGGPEPVTWRDLSVYTWCV